MLTIQIPSKRNKQTIGTQDVYFPALLSVINSEDQVQIKVQNGLNTVQHLTLNRVESEQLRNELLTNQYHVTDE